MESAVAFTRLLSVTYLYAKSCEFSDGCLSKRFGCEWQWLQSFPRPLCRAVATASFGESRLRLRVGWEVASCDSAAGQEPRVEDGYRYFQYSHDHKGPNDFGHDYAEWLRAEGLDPEVYLAERQVNDPKSYREGAKLKSFGGLYEPARCRQRATAPSSVPLVYRKVARVYREESQGWTALDVERQSV